MSDFWRPYFVTLAHKHIRKQRRLGLQTASPRQVLKNTFCRYRMPLSVANGASEHGSAARVLTRNYGFTRSDLLLSSGDWSALSMGVVSRDLNLESSEKTVRKAAEERLKTELNYCVHLGE